MSQRKREIQGGENNQRYSQNLQHFSIKFSTIYMDRSLQLKTMNIVISRSLLYHHNRYNNEKSETV